MELQDKKQNHPIESLMQTAMQSIKDMVDVNTVVGDPVETNDGTVIIPISQVACGFAAGGGEYELTGSSKNTELPFAGGSGAGVSVRPMGFLVVRMNDVRLLSVTGNHLAERVIDLVPQIIDKMEGLFKKRDKFSEI
ncbi:MAG: GerW family sporulation protein [Syntrophomonas sp.]|uniref:GerW family sporulation protein n=1 Tax=Syntrophomonas sp. TaxID=2053627 RepID=UPI002606C66C|nr:GerW family sporulation protein [Syntrophomonas sp.]MDD2510657.1 GerW family sporulation protein [Syntrophomonas sp.]MDD4626811.1 GerW family sporulation protein [Syntrophomonas sp.]